MVRQAFFGLYGAGPGGGVRSAEAHDQQRLFACLLFHFEPPESLFFRTKSRSDDRSVIATAVFP